VSKAPSNVRHEAGYLETVYSKLLEVRECGKVTQGASAKPPRSEPLIRVHANMEPLDEWE